MQQNVRSLSDLIYQKMTCVKVKMDQAEWERLLEAVAEIQEWFPDGIAFIGGIAVHAHAAASGTAKLAAMTSDGDFMILLPEFAELRDIAVLTPNRRGGKLQFSKAGFEFDVYVEGQHGLPIPADEAIAASEPRSGLRVACAEHLLVLKLKACEARAGSRKGDKDEDDLVRLLLVHDTWRPELLGRMTCEMRVLLANVVTGDAVVRLSGGNLHEARELRLKTHKSFAAIEKAHDDTPTTMGQATMHPDALDTSALPAPAVRYQPEGKSIPFDVLVREAGMRNVVTFSNPPDVRVYAGTVDFRVPRPGRPVYCIAASTLPAESRRQAREILRRLAYAFGEYGSREIVARHHRDLKSALDGDAAGNTAV